MFAMSSEHLKMFQLKNQNILRDRQMRDGEWGQRMRKQFVTLC